MRMAPLRLTAQVDALGGDGVPEVGSLERGALEVGVSHKHRGILFLQEPGFVQETYDLGFSLSVQAAKRVEGDGARNRPDRFALLGVSQFPNQYQRAHLVEIGLEGHVSSCLILTALIAGRLLGVPQSHDRDEDRGHYQELQPVPQGLGRT